MPESRLRGQPALHWLLFLAVFVVGVLPFWGVDRDFSDGVMGEWAYVTGRLEGMKLWLFESNWWGHYLLYAVCMKIGAVTGIPVWLVIKGWYTLVIAGLCFETWRLARHYGFGTNQALVATCLVACFPSFSIFYASSAMHIGFVWAGLAAHRWLFWNGGWRRWAGILLTVISFQVAANLCLLIVMGAIAWWLQRDRKSLHALAFTIVSAVAFYLFISIVHPPSGEYAGYNKVLFPTSLANILKVAAASALFSTWLVLLALPLAIMAGVGKWAEPAARLFGRAPGWLRSDAARQIGICVLLVIGATLPYVAVGKGPPLFLIGPPRGGSLMWQMYASTGGSFHVPAHAMMFRQATTMGVPFSLLTAALIGAAAAGFGAMAGRRVMLAGAAVAILMNAGLITYGHATRWNQALFDQRIARALQGIAPPAPGMVEIAIAPNAVQPYPIGESNHLLWKAYGRTDWFAIAYYRDDPTWRVEMEKVRQEHLATLGQNPSVARLQFLLMEGWRPETARCLTKITVEVTPQDNSLLARAWQMLRNSAPPAKIVSVDANC